MNGNEKEIQRWKSVIPTIPASLHNKLMQLEINKLLLQSDEMRRITYSGNNLKSSYHHDD